HHGVRAERHGSRLSSRGYRRTGEGALVRLRLPELRHHHFSFAADPSIPRAGHRRHCGATRFLRPRDLQARAARSGHGDVRCPEIQDDAHGLRLGSTSGVRPHTDHGRPIQCGERGPRRDRRPVQACRRRPCHAGRPVSSHVEPRRAAPALERPQRRHVAGRPPAGHPLRGRVLSRMVFRPLRGQAWAYGPLAGERPQRAHLRRDGSLRRRLRRAEVLWPGLADPRPHRFGRRAPAWRRLISSRAEPFGSNRQVVPFLVNPPVDAAEEPVRTAVVGYGYWGPNLVRNIAERPELDLAGLCELDVTRAGSFRQRYPHAALWRDFEDLLADPDVEALAIATPPATHYDLAMRALSAGKHVLVEKPLAMTANDALNLIDFAESTDRVLMPGHTFVYSASVNAVRDLIRDGVLGEVYFVTSSRMNLGKYQQDGVVRDLAPHDLSILLYWLDERVIQVAATAQSIFQTGVAETAFMTLTFETGTTANVQISWLAPRKVRQMIVVGSR